MRTMSKQWWVVYCTDCRPILPQPFSGEGEAEGWKTLHEATTGHEVLMRKEEH